MNKEKINYKGTFGKIVPALVAILFMFGAVKIFSSAFNKQSNVISPEQKIVEQEQRIKELEDDLKNERNKNIEANFISESLNGIFKGNYVSSTMSEDDYTFDLEFMDNLKAKIKIRCKYETEDNEILINSITYPVQKMQIVDQDAKQGYVFFEGIDITSPKAYNDAQQELSSESIKFSLLSDKQLQTFDMKVWIKDGEMTGFLFDKDGKEFARISAQKMVENKEDENKQS